MGVDCDGPYLDKEIDRTRPVALLMFCFDTFDRQAGRSCKGPYGHVVLD